MGAAVSGHSSCPDHHGRLKRVDGNDVAGARCGVCQIAVGVGARVHRCRNPGCGFVLHDACFRFPATVKRHLAHPGHRLTLGAVAGGHDCSLCAERLVAHAYAYTCAAKPACSTGGFRAHPSCCHLPPSISGAAQHKHGRLVLSQPSTGGGNNGKRCCLECRTTTARAWSYQCPDPECMDVEVCIKCAIGGNGNAARCCSVPGCGGVELGCLGVGIGRLLCGIGQGMGLPGFTVQSAPAMRK